MELLMRDMQGNIIPTGKVKKELVEPFLKAELPFWLKATNGGRKFKKVEITAATQTGYAVTYNRFDVVVGQSYDFSFYVKGSGTVKGLAEIVFRDGSEFNYEVGTRRTIQFDLTAQFQKVDITSVTIPAGALKVDINIGIKSVNAGDIGVAYFDDVIGLNKTTGKNDLLNGHFEDGDIRWSTYKSTGITASFLTEDNVLNYREITPVYALPDTSFGYMQLTSEQIYNSSPKLMSFEINASMFREISWTIEALHLSTDSGLATVGIAIKDLSNTSGVLFFQDNTMQTMVLRRYKPDGTFIDANTKYRVKGDNEATRRRNITITLLPQSKKVYLLEDDQVMYMRDVTEVDFNKKIRCMVDITNRDDTQQNNFYFRLSQVKLNLIHN